MAKIKLEIDGSGVSDTADRLLAMATNADEVGQSAARAQKLIGDASKDAVTNQNKLNVALREELKARMKQGESIDFIRNSIREQQKALRDSTLQQMKDIGALTKEEQKMASAIADVIAEFNRLEDAAGIIDGIAAATANENSKRREQLDLLRQSASTLSALQEQQKKTTAGPELERINEQLDIAQSEYLGLLASTAKVNEEWMQQVGILGQVKAEIEALQAQQQTATTVEDLQRANAQLEIAQENYRNLVSDSGRFAEEQKKEVGLLGQVQAKVRQLQAAQAKANNPADLARINKELADAEQSYRDLNNLGLDFAENNDKGAVSLRARMRNARMEVVRLIEETGKIGPEVLVAAQQAAHLADEIGDVDALIEAMNPEAKFQAVAQTATAVAGGFSAVQGAMALLGSQSEETEKILLKVNAVMAISQGLNAYGGIIDALKNVKALLVVVTSAKAREAVVTGTSTGATIADTVAKAANSAATLGLTGSVKALTAAVMANPLLAAVAILAGIATAVIALGDDADSATKQTEGLVEMLDRMRGVRADIADLQKDRSDIASEVQLIKEGSTAEAERRKIMRDGAVERALAQAKINGLLEDEKRINQQIAAISGDDSKEGLEALKKLQEARQAAADERRKLNGEVVVSTEKQELELLKFEQEQEAERVKNADEAAKERQRIAEEEAAFELKIREDLQAGIDALNERAKSSAASAQVAELERQATEAAQNKQFDQERKFREQIITLKEQEGQAEIDVLQRDLERRLALITLEQQIGSAAVKDLTQAQLNARLDALVKEKGIALDEEQLAQFAVLRAQVRANAEREITKAKVEEVSKRTAAENEEFRAQLEAIDLQDQYAQARIDAAGQDQAELVRILQQSGVEGVSAVRSGEEAKLLVQLEFQQKRLELLSQSGDQADAIEAEKLKSLIAGLRKQIADIPEGGFDLAKLLGITPEQLEKLKPLLSNALNSALQFAKVSLFDDKLAGLDRYLSGLDEASKATEEALNREAEFRAQGLTNDYEGQKARLEQLQKLQEEAIREKERLAARQRILEQGQVVGGTILSVVNILKDSTLKGGVVGLAIAAAVIPTIFGLITAAKNRAKEVGQYWTGTPYVKRNGAPTGRDTVPAMLTEGERVHTVEENRTHWDLFEGLRLGKKDLLMRGMAKAADHHGLSLEEVLSGFLGPVALPARARGLAGDIAGSRERMERIRRADAFSDALRIGMEDVATNTAELVRIEKSRVDRHYLPDGTMIEHKGNITKIKRPKA